MKRRRNVDTRVKEEVARLLLENPDYTGEQLKRKTEKSLKRFHYSFTQRTYQNIKAELWPNIKENNPLDKPWTMLSLKDYPVPPEAIPILFEIQNSDSVTDLVTIEDCKTGKITNIRYVFTVRHAIWVSRLFPTIISFNAGKTPSEIAGKVYSWARAYSEQERLGEVMERGVDSSYLDRRLFKTRAEGYPYRSEDEKYVAEIIMDPNTWKNPELTKHEEAQK